MTSLDNIRRSDGFKRAQVWVWGASIGLLFVSAAATLWVAFRVMPQRVTRAVGEVVPPELLAAINQAWLEWLENVSILLIASLLVNIGMLIVVWKATRLQDSIGTRG